MRSNLFFFPASGGTFTLAPSGVYNLDFDLDQCNNLQLMIEETYDATASTTGLTARLHQGFGGSDTVNGQARVVVGGGTSAATFATNYETVTMETVTPDSSTPVTFRTSFFLSDVDVKWARWVRLYLVNTDPTNNVRVRVFGDY